MVSIDAVSVAPWRLRGLGDTEGLRESIASNGLLQPIVVDASLTLVCGMHRLEACRALGWTEVPAFVQSIDGPRAQLAEVDENLCRRELTVLERAEHIALRRKLWEQMHPPPAPEGKKKPKKHEAPLAMFVDDTARRTGRANAAVREELRIGELPEDVRAAARETPVSDNKKELLALTRMPEEEQRRAVEAVKSGEAKSVRKRAPRPAPEAEELAPEGEATSPVAGESPVVVEVAEATRGDEGWPRWSSAPVNDATRADTLRLVNDARRALAETLTLWSQDPDDEGRCRLEEAHRAVERLARWMESAGPTDWGAELGANERRDEVELAG